MKHGRPLQRRIGLKTNTPLRAGKPLKRDPAVPGNSPVNRVRSKPRKNTDPPQSVKELVEGRSRSVCEIQIHGLCTRTATDIHHRSGRGMGGTSRPEINEVPNLLHLCRSCHHAVTDTAGHRAEYERNGWIVRRIQDAATKPVLHRGRRVLLDNNGDTTPVATKEEAE